MATIDWSSPTSGLRQTPSSGSTLRDGPRCGGSDGGRSAGAFDAPNSGMETGSLWGDSSRLIPNVRCSPGPGRRIRPEKRSSRDDSPNLDSLISIADASPATARSIPGWHRYSAKQERGPYPPRPRPDRTPTDELPTEFLTDARPASGSTGRSPRPSHSPRHHRGDLSGSGPAHAGDLDAPGAERRGT